MSRPYCIGLTGGAGSGKSTAAGMFVALGVPVQDADQVARTIVAPGSLALTAIGDCFGSSVLTADGGMDRAAMRKIVFADPDARRQLEAITHPAIRAELLAWRNAQRADYCVLEVSILFESGFHSLVDRSLLIDIEPAVQLQRLMARDHIDRELAERMLAAQMMPEQRRALADDILANDGDLDALNAGITAMHARYLQQSAQRRTQT